MKRWFIKRGERGGSALSSSQVVTISDPGFEDGGSTGVSLSGADSGGAATADEIKAAVASVGKRASAALESENKEKRSEMIGYTANTRGRDGAGRPLPAYAAAKVPATTQPVLTPVRKAATTAPVRLSPVAPKVDGTVAKPQQADVRLRAAAVPAEAPVSSGNTSGFALRPRKTTSSIGQSVSPVSAPAAAAVSPAEGGAADGVLRPKSDQRALYYQLMNGLYDALLILDERGHVLDCSERVTKVLGYTREDAWDLAISVIIPGMSSQMFEHLKRNLSDSQHILIDARCNRKDGSSFAAEVGVSTISLTRGNNIVFSVRNIERRKQAMDELRRGQAGMEVSLAPAFVCDLDGFFGSVNSSFLESFGIPDADAATRVRFTDLLPSAGQQFLRAANGEDVREMLSVPVEGSNPLRVELALKPVRSSKRITAIAGSMLQV